MESFGNLFNLIFYQPLQWALMFLYNYLPGNDFGVAVIALTVLVKLMLYPLGIQGIKSQKALQGLQPKIKEIQEKFKDDKTRQAKETMDLYKKEKINPFSSFLLLLIQLPILFALFKVFGTGLGNMAGIDTTFLGIINLAEGSAVLVILSGIAQFWQTKMMAPPSTRSARSGQAADFSGMMQKQMLYFFPIFTIFILWRMPSAIALYWLTTTLFTIAQQYITVGKSLSAGRQDKKNAN
ncbi:MAG: membrane protein insertase YidC [Candidatus Nealsonbacteria bacterium]|nr:membrane protein insertase YidC [Candidatus Nealsonbacteria bacterium]